MKGLTLLEVLVALAMVAVALTAGLSLQASLAAQAARAPDALLAEVCARKQLTALVLSRQLPAPGTASQACAQAGVQLEVWTEVSLAQDPGFRHVQVRVRRAGPANPWLLQLATVQGRY